MQRGPTHILYPGLGGVIQVRAAPASSAAFAPSDLSGLTLWLKADAGTFQDNLFATPATADGDPVGGWQDQSTSAFHVTQTVTAEKPTLKLSQINGLPALSFDGGDIIASASITVLNLVANNAATTFVVMYQNSADAQNNVIRLSPGGVEFFAAYLSYDDTFIYDHGSFSSGGRISGAQPAGWDNTWHAVELYRSAGTGEINVDGTTTVSGTFTDSLNAGSGVLGLSDTYRMTGYIAEIVVYNRALTASERAQVETYLNTRYGIVFS